MDRYGITSSVAREAWRRACGVQIFQQSLGVTGITLSETQKLKIQQPLLFGLTLEEAARRGNQLARLPSWSFLKQNLRIFNCYN